jgi:hypothetical protein
LEVDFEQCREGSRPTDAGGGEAQRFYLPATFSISLSLIKHLAITRSDGIVAADRRRENAVNDKRYQLSVSGFRRFAEDFRARRIRGIDTVPAHTEEAIGLSLIAAQSGQQSGRKQLNRLNSSKKLGSHFALGNLRAPMRR